MHIQTSPASDFSMIALRSSILCASFWMANRTHLISSSLSDASEWRDLIAAAISATNSSRSCFVIATTATPFYKDDATTAKLPPIWFRHALIYQA